MFGTGSLKTKELLPTRSVKSRFKELSQNCGFYSRHRSFSLFLGYLFIVTRIVNYLVLHLIRFWQRIESLVPDFPRFASAFYA